MFFKVYWSILLMLFRFWNFDGHKANANPNVIYILADDLGYGDLGCYGQKIIKTPHLDRLAKEGMLFTNHYAGSSVCAPSRAALMLGQHTGHNRVRGNYESGPMGFGACLELLDENTTVAEVLKKKGYKNAVIGKWGLGMNGTTGEPNKQGFDYSYGFLNQGHAHFQFPSYVFRNGQRLEIPENRNLSNKRFSNDIFTEEALGFIEKSKKDPFFLYLAYTTPHAEMLLPESKTFESYKGIVDEMPYQKKGIPDTSDNNAGQYRSQNYPAAAYAAQITHLDSCVGELIKKIKESGLEKNTLIMFSSDNGPHAEGGAHPSYFKSNGELRGKKRDLYEGGIRVPFIVKWPKIIKANSISNHISAFWDLMPTLADIAGIFDSSLPLDGISFYETLKGNERNQKKHAYLYWEFHENPSSNQAIRMGDWKAIRKSPQGPIELFNLKNDISESTDLAEQNPEMIAQMKIIFKEGRTENAFWKLKQN